MKFPIGLQRMPHFVSFVYFRGPKNSLEQASTLTVHLSLTAFGLSAGGADFSSG
jgi:hypothetical protein